MTGRVDMAFYDPETTVIGGTITITNENGAWAGSIRGAGVTADDWVNVIQLDGSGAYRGSAVTLIPVIGGWGQTATRVAGVIYAVDDLDPSKRPLARANAR